MGDCPDCPDSPELERIYEQLDRATQNPESHIDWPLMVDDLAGVSDQWLAGYVEFQVYRLDVFRLLLSQLSNAYFSDPVLGEKRRQRLADDLAYTAASLQCCYRVQQERGLTH